MSTSQNSSPDLCRICYSRASLTEALISPCNCRGTLAHVHPSCLEKWLDASLRPDCELCGLQYRTAPRYGICESLKLFLLHPHNRPQTQADLVVILLLTIVVIFLVTASWICVEYVFGAGKRAGVSLVWVKVLVYTFLGLVVLGYIGCLIIIFKGHLVPWCQWRRAEMRIMPALEVD